MTTKDPILHPDAAKCRADLLLLSSKPPAEVK